MRNKPLVSVVMSVFNAQVYLKRAIESMLNQSLKDFEFIIVNNASGDRTSAIIRSYMRKDKRIRLVNNDLNLKLADSLNVGVSHAKTDIIARMDSDDISFPERLETQYRFLEKHPNVVIVGTNISIIDNSGKIISKREYPTQSSDLKRVMFQYAPFAHPTVMFRKKTFLEFNGYDPKMTQCEDIDFWFRVGSKYEFGNVPKTLLKYTLSMNSNTHYKLRAAELLGFKVKMDAILKYGYRPSFYDVIFNVLQFLTMWVMPAGFRIKLYNLLRSRRYI